MPRFVILEHDHPELHWDLMLDKGDALETWRLSKPPEEAEMVIQATALPGHRRMYLDYEGAVSSNRGTVRRWDTGTYSEGVDPSPDLRVIILHGDHARGRLRLEHVEGAEWRCRWESRAP